MDDEDAVQSIRDGLSTAMADLTIREIDEAFEGHGSEVDPPGIRALEKEVTDAPVAGIAPAVAAMLQAAVGKRRPWSS